MSLVDDDSFFYLEKKHNVSHLIGGGIWDEWLDSNALNQLVHHPLFCAMHERKLTLSNMRFFWFSIIITLEISSNSFVH